MTAAADNGRCGLVLEGGAWRGMFTCGVIDVLLEQGLMPAAAVGVSAGAAFGVNLKSGQAGRALRYSQRFARDPRYCGLRSWLTTGNLYNAQFCYHTVPEQYDRFDFDAFRASPMPFWAVCTDVATGQPVYHLLNDADPDVLLEWIRASASMPLAATMVHVGGRVLLDGGVTDSIPLAFMQRQGYRRNVVVLTQPSSYVKPPNRLLPLMRLRYGRRHGALVQALARRHTMYAAQQQLVHEQERLGHVLVVRPSAPLPIGHVCHDPQLMQQVSLLGRQAALRLLPQLRLWLS